MLKLYQEPVIQKMDDPLLQEKGVSLFIKREDLIHPFVSGNKWRKLKYNLEEAKRQGHTTILTFGGAYSNHIYATAAAAKESGFSSIGIIRGDELVNKPMNKTLQFASDNGMRLEYIARDSYRKKENAGFIKMLKTKYGNFYLIPEGGTNNLAIKGCVEILNENTARFNYICSSVGTGGTLSGLIVASEANQKLLGFSSLKGNFLKDEVNDLVSNYMGRSKSNWTINSDYHFGGYAKTTPELIEFIQDFEGKHNIMLDQVYTGKMIFGIYDLIEKGYFESGTKILAIHTGGLQGRSELLSFD